MPMTGTAPLPYKKTDKTPNLGFVDQADDIRGGMGIEGPDEAGEVRAGGRHADHRRIDDDDLPGLRRSPAASRSKRRRSSSCADRSCAASGPTRRARSPTATRTPTCRSTSTRSPVLNAGGGGIPPEFAGFFGGGGAGNAGMAQNIDAERAAAAHLAARAGATPPRCTKPQAGRRGGVPAAWRRQFGITLRRRAAARGAVVPAESERHAAVGHARRTASSSSNRAALVDVPLGKGHVVMFAIRPFWRWQTQGTYSLGFNAIMNWNDLDAGKSTERPNDYRRATAAVTGSRARISAIAASNFASVDARWLLVCSFKHSGSSLT